MADSSIAVLDAVTRAPVGVDTRTAPDGDSRQVVVMGDGTTAAVAEVDAGGRLRVAAQPGIVAPAVGAVDTVAATLVYNVDQLSNIAFSVKNAGSVTLAAGTFVWEASLDSTNGTDGTWFPFQAARIQANTIETTIALSGIAPATGYGTAWEASVNAYAWVRIRNTVAVTASASAVWTIRGGTYATEPIPAAQVSATQPISGSVTTTSTTPAANNVSSAATTNATSIKTTAGTVYSIVASNTGAAAAFVKLYNVATAPTVGTTAVILTIPVPAGGIVTVPLPVGHRFTVGIGLAITNLAADSDATAVALGQVKVLVAYA